MRRWLRVFGLIGLVATAVHAQDVTSVAPTLVPATTSRTVVPTSAAIVPGSRAAALTKADVDTWLDGYMPAALRTADIPGAVVTIVKDGKILTARGFGYADRDKRTPVDPEKTLFRPGSVSKLFTWTAVMQQVEAGKLDLDTDINKYLDFKIPPYNGQPITLRQVMTHTAGFEETSKAIVFYDPKLNLSLEQYIKRWTPVRIYAPGTTPAYSNWATALAAYIVQRSSGEPFEAYLERHIFVPLGMHNTSFRQPLPSTLAMQMAVGYPKPGQPSPGFEIIGPGPAGEGSSSGTDMARFMIANLQGEVDGARILQPATLAMMHNSPLAHINPVSLIPPLNRMELGFFETNLNGREIIGHLGDTIAFHTSLHLFLREGVGLYVSFNSPGRNGAVGALRTAIFQDFTDRYYPNIAAPDGRIDPKISAQHAAAMTGTWQATRRAETSFLSVLSLVSQAKVGVGPKGELIVPSLVGQNGRPRDWVEIAPYVWRDRNGHDRLAVQLDGAGRVVRWCYDLAAPFEMFDRVPLLRSGALVLPALGASAVVLLLTLLYWPVAWRVRRRYAAVPTTTGTALRAYRATRIMSGATLVMLIAWVAALATLLGSPDQLAGGLDPVLWILKILGSIVFVGAVLITGWNAAVSWTDNRSLWRKLWNTLILLSTLVILGAAIEFCLLTLSVHY